MLQTADFRRDHPFQDFIAHVGARILWPVAAFATVFVLQFLVLFYVVGFGFARVAGIGFNPTPALGFDVGRELARITIWTFLAWPFLISPAFTAAILFLKPDAFRRSMKDM